MELKATGKNDTQQKRGNLIHTELSIYRNEGCWQKFDISRPLVVIRVTGDFTIFHYCLFQHETKVFKCFRILSSMVTE